MVCFNLKSQAQKFLNKRKKGFIDLKAGSSPERKKFLIKAIKSLKLRKVKGRNRLQNLWCVEGM